MTDRGVVAPDPSFDPRSFAILVVDENDASRGLLARILEAAGYYTLLVRTGAEAAARLTSSGCDLVILDSAPGGRGLDTLRDIRRRHGPVQLPVITMSARADGDNVAACLQAGANDHVSKPVDGPALRARVQTQLTLKSAVEELRASEQRFRLLAELSADMISLHAPDGTFRFASPACRELLGVEPGELEGHFLHEWLHPVDQAAMPARIGDLPESCTLLVRLRRADGSWVWCEVKSRGIRGSRTGKITDVQLSTRDVSFYVDAWTGLPRSNAPPMFGGTPVPVSTTTHPDVASSVFVHQEHLVKASVEPPPVRRRRPTLTTE